MFLIFAEIVWKDLIFQTIISSKDDNYMNYDNSIKKPKVKVYQIYTLVWYKHKKKNNMKSIN